MKPLYIRLNDKDYESLKYIHNLYSSSLKESGIIKEKDNNSLSLNKTVKLMINMQKQMVKQK